MILNLHLLILLLLLIVVIINASTYSLPLMNAQVPGIVLSVFSFINSVISHDRMVSCEMLELLYILPNKMYEKSIMLC